MPYDLLDTDEAARLLGITSAGVRDLIRRGKLPAHRAGRGYLLPARPVYAEGLDAMLKSAGLAKFVNPRIEEGGAWVVQKGNVGKVGFETVLTVEVYDERATRSQWVQAYAVPAFAVNRPYAAKQIALPA